MIQKRRKLVLLRHGQSLWNLENKFTGWRDIDLSPQGYQEAKEAGRLLLDEGFVFDVAFTSVMKRAIRTLWIVLDRMDMMWIPIHTSLCLNEKHYGALQGANKSETIAKHGKEMVQQWRRSFEISAPPMAMEDFLNQKKDPRYCHLKNQPTTESLHDTHDRVLSYWHQKILPCLQNEQTVLIVAHGNSLRSLIKFLDKISDEDITTLNIPTGNPLVYELDSHLTPVTHYYLGNQESQDV